MSKILDADGKPSKAPPPKLGIVIPSGDQVHANFAMSLAAMTYSMGIPLALINQKGSSIAANRNNGLQQCLDHGMDWCLMIDSDITFPSDAALRLLKHAIQNDLDIVGATYARRSVPHNNLAVPLNRESATVSGLTEVEALPTGFLMIRVACLAQMKRPYFRFHAIEEGEALPAMFRDMAPDTGEPRIIGEDYYFCVAAKSAGLRIWLDSDLSFELVHWGENGVQLVNTTEADQDQFVRVELNQAPAS